ncbi:MAG: TonB-dependent receptor [Woeseiaceae bacterium]
MKLQKKAFTPKVTRSAIAAAVASAIAAPAAFAQQSSDQGFVMEEILVTATKRVQSVQDVPISITAVTGDKLRELNVVNVLDLQKTVPGMKLNYSGNQPVPIIRGAGTAGTTDIAVPIYVDFMYRPLAAQGLASYVDVERIEVLRGPQGTLFGRNTLGGLINVISKKPQFDEFDYGVSLAVGDYSLRRVEGFVNIPFSDTVAMRLTATDTERDPYVENTFNKKAGLKDADNTYIRAQLKFAPNDSFDATLGITSWNDDANGNADYAYKCLGIPVNATTQMFDGSSTGFIDPRCGTRDGWDGGRSQAGNVTNGDESALRIPDPFKIGFDFQPVRDIQEDSVSLDVNWRFANHHLVVRGATFDLTEDVITDTDLSSNNALVAGHLRQSDATQIDVNLNSDSDGKLQYTLGYYMYDDTSVGDNTYAFIWGYTYSDPTDPSWATWLYQGNGGTKSTAIYGQAEYSFTDKVRATVGIRSSDDKRRSFSLNVDPSTLSDSTPGYAGTPTPIKGDDSHTDYRVGLSYDLRDDVMLYGTLSTGYIAGGVQALSNSLLDPNEVDATELGFKGTFADGRLRLNGAWYKSEYENLTTTVFVVAGAAQTIIAQQVPGGSLTSSGFEFEGSWYPTDQLSIDFGLSIDDSEFDDFNAANRVGSVAGGYPGSDFIDDDGAGWFILDGEKPRFSPDMTLSVGLSYQMNFANGSGLKPWIYSYWSDDYKTTNDPIFWANQDSYNSIDLGATWQSPSGVITVGAFVNNATDEYIMTDGTMFSRGRAMADFASPRNYGIRFNYNY